MPLRFVPLVIFALLYCDVNDRSADAKRIVPTTMWNSSGYRSRVHPDDEYDVGQKQGRRRQVTVNIPTDPNEHLVESLPLLKDGSFQSKHWAGLLEASPNKDKYLFYWLFEPDPVSAAGFEEDDIPFVIWINGGPGCSSMDGLFLENGPFHFVLGSSGEYELAPNEHSWHKIPAYTLYIDQPVGTGLSFTTTSKYPSSNRAVSLDLYYFLQSFFKLHRDKFVKTDGNGMDQVKLPFFFSTESYGGRYVPDMIDYMLSKGTDMEEGEIHIPVRGAAIGNGWVYPYYQYSVAEVAYGHGLIGLSQFYALLKEERECQKKLDDGETYAHVCMRLMDVVVDESFGHGSKTQLCSYDIRLSGVSFPPGHEIVETYLGGWELKRTFEGRLDPSIRESVLQALHASESSAAGQRFKECTDPPYDALASLDGVSAAPQVVNILNHPDKLGLLFFNGVLDLVCNHGGNDKFLENTDWKYRDDWTKAKRYAWVAPSEEKDKISGYMKEYENLKYLKVLRSGHMVPMDVPSVALDMMRIFVLGGSFQTREQSIPRASPGTGSSSLSSSCNPCPTCPAVVEGSGLGAGKGGVNDGDSGGSGRALKLIVALIVIAGVGYYFVMRSRKTRRRAGGVPPIEVVQPEFRDDDNNVEMEVYMDEFRNRKGGEES